METGGLLMKNDFQTMTIKQLKKYILEHREDQEVFTIFMDKIEAQSSNKIYNANDIEQFSDILKQHQN
jgi:hypothetical protein